MKTLKLLMIASFVTFTMVSYGNVINLESGPTIRIVEISLEQAVENPGLVAEMYRQLDVDMLDPASRKEIYTFDVYYQHFVVRITGTLSEWGLFFNSEKLEVIKQPIQT